MPVFDQESVDRLKQILKWHPRGVTISDLATKLEINRNLVAKYLDILLVSGQVEMQVMGAAKVYFLSHRIPITSMLEFSSDMLIILDRNEKINWVNEPVLLLLNMKKEMLTGRTIKEIDHPFLSAIPVTVPTKGTGSGHDEVREFECTLEGKKYNYKIKQLQTAFENGSHGITLIIEDITAQVTYRKMLELNETRYRGIVEDQTEFITRFLPEGTLVFINDAYARYLRKNKEDLLGKQHIPGIESQDITTVQRCIQSLNTQNPVKTFECRINHPCGKVRWNLWTVRALFDTTQKPIEYQGVGRDNTEKREAATKINQYVRDMEFLSRKAQELVELSYDADIFQVIAQGLFEIIPDSLLTVNSIDVISGTLTIRTVLPKRDQEILTKILENDLLGFQFNINSLPEEQKMKFFSALQARELINVEENLHTLFFHQIPQDTCDLISKNLDLGDSIYIIGLIRHGQIFGNISFSPRKGKNVTNSSIIETFVRLASIVLHRRRTDEALKASEQLYRSVIENIQDVFYRSDKEGNLIMASPSWAKVLMYDSLNDCIGYNIADKFYFEPQRREEFLDAVFRNGSVSDYEVILKCRDGSPLFVSTNSHLYYDDAGSLLGVEGIFREIGEGHAAIEKNQQQVKEIELFSRKLQEFIELPPESDLFYATGAGLHEILPQYTKTQFIPGTPGEISIMNAADPVSPLQDPIKTPVLLTPNYLSSALKMARDYIAILDRSGKCVWVNDAFAIAVNGGRFDDLAGKSIALYIAPEFRKMALDSLMEVKKTGNKTVPFMMLSSSGRVPVEANISAIIAEDGDLFGYMAIARHIERGKVENSR